jgi:hypothetical protein
MQITFIILCYVLCDLDLRQYDAIVSKVPQSMAEK